MSSVVAHGIVGVAALEAARAFQPAVFEGRRWPFVFAAVSMLPDVDAVLGAVSAGTFDFLSLPGGYPVHRGVTHSLAFAVVSGIVAAVLAAGSPRRWPAAAFWLALTAATHPLVDVLMGRGAGIPLFWPLTTERFLSPLPLVPVAYFSYSVGGLLALLLEPHVWALVLHELVIFLPVLFLARRFRERRIGAGTSPAPSRARVPATIALSAIACPVMLLLTGLRVAEGDLGNVSMTVFVVTWLAIVMLALMLTRTAARDDRSALGRFGPVAASVLISGLASFVV